MAFSIVKLQKNKNVTLPTWLIRRFHIGPGDFLKLQETRQGVLIKPGKLIDPSQAYFWTKEWQEREREVDEDIKAGRVTKTRNLKELFRELDRGRRSR